MTARKSALPRHHLVWLEPDAIERGLAETLDPQHRQAASDWFRQKRPAIVRSRRCGEPETCCCLGIPLPLEARRQRVTLRASLKAIVQDAPPPKLRDALAAAPSSWQPRLAVLTREIEAAGANARVYGSLAWQWLTGERYLSPQSDADLLIEANSRSHLSEIFECLERHISSVTPKLDGEIVLPEGRAAAWREVLSGAATVLVRTQSRACLVPRGEFLLSTLQLQGGGLRLWG